MISIILSISLAIDAFATAVSLGLSSTVRKQKDKFKVALFFGFFQFIMPAISVFLILPFTEKYQFYINVFGTMCLLILGGKMIYESFQPQPNLCDKTVCDDMCIKNVCMRTGKSKSLSNKKLLQYSIATSIDALVAGLVISTLELNFILTITLIGVITFILSYIGVNFGRFIKVNMEKRFELIGGVILVLLAVKSII